MKTTYLSKQIKDFMQASLLAVSLLGAHSAIAGERGGNGGDGIQIGGKLYVLDLVEAGVEQASDPAHLIFEDANVNVLARLRTKFANQNFPIEMIAKKIAQIESVHALFARTILKGIELYNWRLVNSGLINITDENSLLDYENLIQLAIRRNSNVLISRSYWEQLDDLNKTALVFHEVLYALVKPTSVNTQDSVVARELVGHLFSQEFNRQSVAGLRRAIGDRFNFQWQSMLLNKVNDSTGLIGNGTHTLISFNPEVVLEGPNTQFGNDSRSIIVTDAAYEQASVNNSYIYNACQLGRTWRRSFQYATINEFAQVATISLRTVDQQTFLDVTMTSHLGPVQRITLSNDDSCLDFGNRSTRQVYQRLQRVYGINQ